jgi:hypothetical protein
MKTWMKILIALIIIGIVVGVFVYRYVNHGHPDYVSAKADLTIRAKRLYVDYSKNKDIADPKYTGKVIILEGPISKIEAVDSLVVLVYSYETGDFGDMGIRVTMLPEYNNAAKQLSIVKPSRIKGYCTGYNGTDVILEKGSILKNDEE